MKNYRLGIDLGSTSLGWSIIELSKGKEPTKLLNLGVRIFPDGRDAKSREPLNKKRRDHRSMRRNRDRYLQRKQHLLDCLIKNKLMPEDTIEQKGMEKLDPYKLRVRALDEKISLYEFGRALFHLNQRRGFKSNRKLDADDKETSTMKNAIKKLQNELKNAGARTLGEYLFNLNKDNNKHHQRKPLRVKTTANGYNLYPNRKMYEDEFEILWKKQSEYHKELNSEMKERIKNIIFFQRPLKPQPKGKCRFEPDEPRCPVAFPIYQQFRIYQEVNNLRLLDYDRVGHDLTNEQRTLILKAVFTQKKTAFKALRKKLGKEYAQDYVFNLESEKRKDMKGDETSFTLRKDDYFGTKWDELNDNEQDEIIIRIINEDNDIEIEETLISWLCDSFKLHKENAEKISNLRLPQGIGSVSKKAINKILPFLKEGFIYSESCEKSGYHHSDFRTGEVFDEGNLPYYGEVMPQHVAFGTDEPDDIDDIRFGKIPNPTVHIALNQLRKFINALAKKYGAPSQIVVELARELPLGKERLNDLKNEQSKNKKYNEIIAEELEKIGVENTYQNRLKYKLWDELDKDPTKRCCPYTGKHISLNAVDGLFSNKFEIEHILPKSKTFNDRPANKTVSYFKANRDKGERCPFEAFGHNPKGYEWDEILARAEKLPKNKRWKFYPDAMKNFENENDVISRMLTDTQYMSKVAREYMSYVCGPYNVWVIPGQLTAKIRSKWGLNELLSNDSKKNREDHRHHSIDAFVVACTSRSMLQKIARASEISRNRFIDDMPSPFNDFQHEEMKDLLDNTTISFKPDHGNAKAAIKRKQTVGQLHDETAYGFVSEDIKKGRITLSVRKPLISLDSEKNIKKIVSVTIRNDLLSLIDGKSKNEIKNILVQYSKEHGINRVKIHEEKDKKTVIPIYNKKGEIYKYYLSGSNYCADIYCSNKGDKAGKWQVEIIPMFKAHKPDFEPEWHKQNPTAKKIMRLFMNDYVAFDEDGERKIRRVRKMTGNVVYLRELNIALKEKGKEDIGEQFRPYTLQEKNARKIGIDILGNVHDPEQQDENNRN
ncbi:MAG: type II CRISPR RNA-guided endonuclease Cas9 [Bacteroidales bacterium]|nr:type II CRISPR RNA-guided endonuclease Cas9 [Bacteroidales bacterium]